MSEPRHTRTSQALTGLAGLAFERYGQALQRYLMRRLHQRHDAHDLAQEVYLRLLRVADADLVRKPQAYMYRIASHVIYEFRLKEEQEKDCMVVDSDVLTDLAERVGDASTDDIEGRIGSQLDVDRILSRLPPIEQAIVLLQKRDGLSYQQVAERLGLSKHTVKKYLFRALAHLRSAANEELGK